MKFCVICSRASSQCVIPLTTRYLPRDVHGTKFLDPTRPDLTQYPTDPTQPDSRIFGKDTTRAKPKAVLQLSINYFNMSILFCMHVKINTNMRYKREYIVNMQLSSVTRARVFIPSRISIRLARLLPLCLPTVVI